MNYSLTPIAQNFTYYEMQQSYLYSFKDSIIAYLRYNLEHTTLKNLDIIKECSSKFGHMEGIEERIYQEYLKYANKLEIETFKVLGLVIKKM